MSVRNRVDPWGGVQAVEGVAGFIGNRGCLVDAGGTVVRRQASRAWITCVLRHKDWRQPLAAPRTWTPLFFLDDAVALAAGHRPCGLCRRDDHRSFSRASGAHSVSLALENGGGGPARVLDGRLAAERGRPWEAPADDLPDGTVLVDGDDRALLVRGDAVRPFAFTGWGEPERRPRGTVLVLTPPTSVRALRGGFVPTLND